MIHIYHGNGKGKTTAAVGLAVRAVGAGLKVIFVQFLKNGSSSEIKMLKDNMEVEYCKECSKFTFQMNEEEKALVTEKHNQMIEKAFENGADMIILDEFLDAYNKKMIDRNLSEKLISENKEKTEIVLTGRNPAEIFIEQADYISEITAVRHPYENGIIARIGIEY